MRKDRKAFLIARAYNNMFCQLLRVMVRDFRKGKLSGIKLEKICKSFGLTVRSEYLKRKTIDN